MTIEARAAEAAVLEREKCGMDVECFRRFEPLYFLEPARKCHPFRARIRNYLSVLRRYSTIRANRRIVRRIKIYKRYSKLVRSRAYSPKLMVGNYRDDVCIKLRLRLAGALAKARRV